MRRWIPSTKSLRCFEAAARLENFTRAAEELNLSQGAVSRQIQILEELVGQPLFVRTRQRVKLTQAGQSYLAEITPLLAGLELATLKLTSYRDKAGGLNVGTYPTLGSRWLLAHLLHFARSEPEISANLITYVDNAQFDPDVIDIGIVQGDPPWPGLRCDYLMPEDLAPVAAPALLEGQPPIEAPEQLLRFSLLQHTTRPESWKIWFESQGHDSPKSLAGPHFSEFQIIIEATLAGHGIAMLPLVLVGKELAAGRLRIAFDHVARPKSAYYLLTPNRKIGIKRIETFRDWLLAEVRREDEGSGVQFV